MSPSFPHPLCCFLLLLLVLSGAQQLYEKNKQLDCYATNSSSTPGFSCSPPSASPPTCPSFLIFRSQTNYQTPVVIGYLLGADANAIARLNEVNDVDPIPLRTLVVVPLNCSCSAGTTYYQHDATYYIKRTGETYFSIANDTYQGLTSCRALIDQNPSHDSRNLTEGMRLSVPLRCACPSQTQQAAGFRYLLSYLITWSDDVSTIAARFRVDPQDVLRANNLASGDSIFPFTTLLVPLSANFYNSSEMVYVPLPANATPPVAAGEKKKSGVGTAFAVAIPVVAVLVLISVICICLRRRKANKKIQNTTTNTHTEEFTAIESLLFDLSTLQVATGNFSDINKLGQGGFGEVYKGFLPNGHEIAVKRVSRGSSQGVEQLKNEVVLLAKLQHRNLVRLLGVCFEGEEKLLVYEFVPNRSLDTILFDPTKSQQLHWEIRYKIIVEIARGLQYLHEDSPHKIIHRDLKASNILLNSDMKPKISDFGLARLFGEDQTQESTTCIVGTFGYMAPEYVMRGHFSNKSDVFSFGVLVLEIVTGRKRTHFFNSGCSIDLLSTVWEHWTNERILDTIDPSLGGRYQQSEVLRCIQLGMLCVQEAPTSRPTMSSVVLTLNSRSVPLQVPSQPAFFHGNNTNLILYSQNEVSVTELEGR